MVCLVPRDWRSRESGVSTFVGIVHDRWLHDYDCRFVEAGSQSMMALSPRRSVPSAPVLLPTVRLAAGYIRQLCSDYVFCRRSGICAQRGTIVVNEFGCETMPIALRLANPHARLVAIAHTYPGIGIEATNPWRRFVERMCYLSVSEVVFNSNYNRDAWTRKLGRPVGKGRVILLGMPSPEETVPTDYPPRNAGEGVDFVCVAQFTANKGQMGLVEAWEELRGGHPRSTTRLVLVGSGQEEANVRGFAERKGMVGSDVVFMGGRSRGCDYFNAGDVAVHLPRESEAFGLVLLEAMSRGKPVIASRLGGIPEVVADGETGFLVDPHDRKEVLKTIRMLACDRELRARMGRAGRQRWLSCFGAERMFGEYKDLFAVTT